MKFLFPSVVLLFVCLISTSSARKLSSDEEFGEANVKINNNVINKSAVENTASSLINVMGVEVCGNEEEECLKRRAIAEAHLDYIYTQHHKP